MRPSGAHTHPGSGGDLRTLAVVAAAVVLFSSAGAVIVTFITDVLEVLGAMVGFIFAVVVFFVVRAWRKGWRPSLVLAWQPPVELPARQVTPIAARPVQALPAPQINNFNFYGVNADQAAEVVARQQAITGRKD